MTVKSIQTLVSEAMQEIKTINADEAFKMVEDNNCNLIDIREARELEKTGSVENSVHISRGMMEIFLDPNSAYFQQGKLDQIKKWSYFVLVV
jgi:rhodanese-related sulfurtransferase